ncbi:hypothetical protein LT679_03690 [Mucilaginibacter roseus]|uniref:Uncharacterized protein n=1 Tax=Mucilaginibacter roseus TaxID=1528868 RepID=A0ABS8U2C6_9SPHI|nr:hypothetical protein [Mucilaginibacter roseus]MCD8739696.1 hypothetical protein [Mucilaginibacter roseus]
MTERKKAKNQANSGRVTISKDVKDHSNDPFVLKKVEEAKAVINKLTFSEIKK